MGTDREPDGNRHKDGRTARGERVWVEVHESLLRSTADLLSLGETELTPALISKNSGVSTTTFYNHWKDSVSGVIAELNLRIEERVREQATALVESGEHLAAVRVMMEAYALEVVKLGQGAHEMLRWRSGSAFEEGRLAEVEVARLAGSFTSSRNQAVVFASTLAFLVRGLHASFVRVSSYGPDAPPEVREFAMSHLQFIAAHGQAVDDALLIARTRGE